MAGEHVALELETLDGLGAVRRYADAVLRGDLEPSAEALANHGHVLIRLAQRRQYADHFEKQEKQES